MQIQYDERDGKSAVNPFFNGIFGWEYRFVFQISSEPLELNPGLGDQKQTILGRTGKRTKIFKESYNEPDCLRFDKNPDEFWKIEPNHISGLVLDEIRKDLNKPKFLVYTPRYPLSSMDPTIPQFYYDFTQIAEWQPEKKKLLPLEWDPGYLWLAKIPNKDFTHFDFSF